MVSAERKYFQQGLELDRTHPICFSCAQRESYELLTRYSEEYPLPNLPFAYDELEPYVDTLTLKIHHLGHHKGYTDKMNAALKQWREQNPNSKLAHSSILTILVHLSDVPEQWRSALRNNGGGYVNHIFYWNSICSSEHPMNSEPTGKLAIDIAGTFGSYDEFRRIFTEMGSALFGSGYVWLVENGNGELSIISTRNQDCPISDDLYPLLVIDVWEHAYYLKHHNKRSEYINDWWNVVCWGEVERLRHFWWEFNEKKDTTHSEL